MKLWRCVVPLFGVVLSGCVEMPGGDGGQIKDDVVRSSEDSSTDGDSHVAMDGSRNDGQVLMDGMPDDSQPSADGASSDATLTSDGATNDGETSDVVSDGTTARDVVATDTFVASDAVLNLDVVATDALVNFDGVSSDAVAARDGAINSDVVFDVPSCQAGMQLCPGSGCFDLRTDTRACGACDNVCSSTNGVASCVASACSIRCNAGFSDCDNNAATGCEAITASNVMHCGACGRACPGTPNGTPFCVASACTISCNTGYQLVGGACVLVSAPRPVAPISLGDVSVRRPTLRWVLPAGMDGAVVELCRDRACTMVIETIRVIGTSTRPSNPLPARSVVFWRMRGTVAGVMQAAYSATWLFHVPAVDNTGAIDTSTHPHTDLNGDGYDDVIVGSFYASPGGRQRAGIVSVFLGSAVGVAPAQVLEGVGGGDEFGFDSACAGDVNGDGYGDLIAGALLASARGLAAAGTASVYHGGPGGVAIAPARVLEGASAGELFGHTVATAGDINGDGYADVLVGNPNAAPRGRDQAGSLSIFYGSITGLRMAADRVIEGTAAQDFLGQSAASAGDVNGDGLSDVIVSAPQQVGARIAGTAMVYLGDAAGLRAAPQRTLSGVPAGESFGWSVAGAGDVNNDGYSDVIVGSDIASPGGRLQAGTASIYHGSAAGTAAAAARVLEGTNGGDLFGYAVASARDLNGDGYADIVVGGENANRGGQMSVGTASVFYGSAVGIPMLAARTYYGVAAGDSYGRAVAGPGDINGDGFAEVLIGAPYTAVGARFSTGSVDLFYGSLMGIPAAATRTLTGNVARESFGWSVN